VAHNLFEEFLDNKEQYHACERYWEELVTKVAASLGQAGEWKREQWRYLTGHPGAVKSNVRCGSEARS
jgi:hypothetical protein